MHSNGEHTDAHLRSFPRPPLPDPEDVSSVYLIGICGTGMGALAGLLQQAGYTVRGSDEAAYPPMSDRLAEMGIVVDEGYDAANLDWPADLVVVGNACTPTHPEASRAREEGRGQCSLPEAISHFFLRDRRSLVVAGTHGKTTTTGMIIQLLRNAHRDPSYLVGGILQNTGDSYAVDSGPHFVIEGDEYDSAYFDKRPKFMHYRPHSAIVTSMEFDHADIYDDWDDYRTAFEKFVALLPEDGLLALNGDDPDVRALKEHTAARVRYFGLESGDDDVTASGMDVVPEGQHFNLVVDGAAVADLFLPMAGRHNLLDALAACAIALDEGLVPEELAAGFASFEGLKRRQEVRGEAGGVLVVDDFAHHPTAVRETIRAARERWPERRVVAVFEPRSNSSRRKTFEEAYGRAFDEAGQVFLSAPPLRHNDERQQLMSPSIVVDAITRRGVQASTYDGADELLSPLQTALRPGDVALIMSNGGFGNIHERLLKSLQSQHT